jgi:hypothetical protein
MKHVFASLLIISAVTSWAQSSRTATRPESEYYVAAYAEHYRVPVSFGTRHRRT